MASEVLPGQLRPSVLSLHSTPSQLEEEMPNYLLKFHKKQLCTRSKSTEYHLIGPYPGPPSHETVRELWNECIQNTKSAWGSGEGIAFRLHHEGLVLV